MTIMTKEQIEEARQVASWESEDCGMVVAARYARTALALHQQLADAQAAQALVLERAADCLQDCNVWCDSQERPDAGWRNGVADAEKHHMAAIRALADPTGVEALAALRRREREGAMQALSSMGQAQEAYEAQLKAEADNAALRARLAEMEGKVGALRDFVEDFAKAKIDALRYSPPHGSSPEDEPDPVVDAETVWAWQSDAKDALAAAGCDA